MFSVVSNFIFHTLLGWTIEGEIDPSLKKYVIIVAPHTSNWDFLIGVMARKSMGIENVKYLGKSQLFRWPYGILFRWLGGYPVDRARHNNWVDAAVDTFNSKDEFAIALAPEGTRSYVGRLKTGFYWIAVKAKVPIYKIGFDFKRKCIVIDDPFIPSGDYEKENPIIMDFFKKITPLHPELGFKMAD